MAIPASGGAVLRALRFHGADPSGLRLLNERQWDEALRFCDRSQLTLVLGALCRADLPERVRERVARDAANHAVKFARLKADFFEIAGALGIQGIEFAALKGLTHSPDFTENPLLRAQGDIDLWFTPETVERANVVVQALGYVPYSETENRHLPPLARPRSWEWKGDFYDPDQPVSVDLHFQLWDGALERIEAPGLEDFWNRRVTRCFDGYAISTLAPADALAFAALHQLLHVLRGDARLQRAWEIAGFLEKRKNDTAFWELWRELHPPGLRALEMVVFAMCARWFAAELPPCLAEDIEQLPEGVALWLDRYVQAPVENLFHPNKNELWLHLALVESFADRRMVFRRRVFPVSRLQEQPANGEPVRWNTRIADLRWSAARALLHARVLPATLAEGVRWWWLRRGLGAPFLKFQLASALFDLGGFVFFVLYNLYLLDLGYNEKFLGLVSGAMTAGTLVGAMPAASAARRFGIRNTLIASILGGAFASLLRAAAPEPSLLLASAFLHGAFLSLWAVCLSPAVAGLSTEKNRSFAFSLIFATGIGIGAVGGLVAGHLPALFTIPEFHLGPLAAMRASLILSSGILLCAAPAALRIRLPPMPPEERKIYPRGPFIMGFLAALLVWMFATGACNPFFNAYFAGRAHFSVERIGWIFTASQLTQVGAVLLAPLCLRALGEVRGVASMQLATALALGVLALTPAGWTAAVLFPVYMAFQYMSSPGMFSMLMERVREPERGGASALNFVVTSLGGVLASLAGGAAISKFGYPAVMGAAAVLAGFAAILFRALIRDKA